MSNCTNLSGELVQELASLPTAAYNLTVIFYGCVQGAFRQVSTYNTDQRECNSPRVTPTYGTSSLVLLLEPNDVGCDPGNNRGLSTASIVGIAVAGGVFFLVLIVIIILALLYRFGNPVVVRMLNSRRKPKPRSQWTTDSVY